VHKKRYAASSVGLKNLNKIFLFGGRTDYNNLMLEEIEEYNADKDEWTIVNLKNPSVWNPVEVCAAIQVNEEQILVFGGSDVRVRDSASSYFFNVTDYSLERTSDLKKAQVFVS
jgi:N-acetylneuraminic acid mutarotase